MIFRSLLIGVIDLGFMREFGEIFGNYKDDSIKL